MENMKQAVFDGRVNERELIKGQLINLVIKGLVKMFDKEKKLFCYKIRKTPEGLEKIGTSYRYTIISLLGLHKFISQGGESPIEVEDTLQALIEHRGQINNIGDYGLLLWLCALAAPERLGQILAKGDGDSILENYPDSRQGKTTELAWFLAGISHSALGSGKYSKEFEGLAIKTAERIKKNYGRKGIFGHMNSSTLAGMIRGRIGCFADQVYPIYALSIFSQAYGDTDALKIAENCGQTICRLQGSLGQWWWHYDAGTGEMVGRYPVYSVHQDGMAPMALFALGEEIGVNFEEPIFKGLIWILGNNELSLMLVDCENNFVWRNLYNRRKRRYLEEALSLLGVGGIRAGSLSLKALFECRPYHLGWLLYAFADKFSDRSIAEMEVDRVKL